MKLRQGAVFFDVDGVIIDSLPAHLQICRDKAAEYGLPITIPSAGEFRQLVKNHVAISPMQNFFRAVGFPEDIASRSTQDYERDFADRYPLPLFPHCEAVLGRLRVIGWSLGIVTSNTRSNISSALGKAIEAFDPRCIFTLDRFDDKPSKSWCLKEGAHILGLSARDCFYIGDLPSDEAAAREAGFHFLGVTYGWGIDRDARRNDLVDALIDVPDKLEAQFAGT